MGEEGEIWEKVREEKRELREKRAKYFIEEVLPMIEAYCEEHSLQLKQLSDYSWRVSNNPPIEGKYVDLWTTRAMRKLDGTHGGMGYMEKPMWVELTKLAMKV